jgi:hypothetical protein
MTQMFISESKFVVTPPCASYRPEGLFLHLLCTVLIDFLPLQVSPRGIVLRTFGSNVDWLLAFRFSRKETLTARLLEEGRGKLRCLLATRFLLFILLART